MSQLRSIFALMAAIGHLVACAPQVPAVLPDPDVDLDLGDVVLLTWTTRSPDGVLGHAMEPGVLAVDPHRRVVDGKARWVETDQNVRILVARQRTVEGKVDGGPVGAQVGASQVTHLAYEVHLTRYLELPPDSLRYAATSGCCFGGQPADTCGRWYVMRMMWGTGKVRYLQRTSADAAVSAGQLLRASGGSVYRQLNEMSFKDTFFAYEALPIETLCSTVAPESELPALAVRAPNNCWASAQRSDGTRATGGWHVSEQDTCRKVVQHHCATTKDLISCEYTFGSVGEAKNGTIPLSDLVRDGQPQPVTPSETW